MSKKILTLSLVFALLIGSLAITASAAEQVLIGAFANGPGGNGGQPAIPYSSAAGHSNIIKTYTPLTALDETGQEIVPYGAESWEVNDDFTVWTFKLRDGLKWNDGKDVTAEDVKFTIEFVTDPEYTPQRTADRNLCWGELVGFKDKIDGKSEELASAEIVDARTIRFTLAGPNPRFFANMYRSYILPKHAVDFAPKDYAATDWWVTAGKQVGSGPFFVADHKEDEYLELAANPHYFAGKPKLDKLIIRFFGGNITSAVLALAAGDVNFSYVNFDDIQTLDDAKFDYYSGNSTVVVFFDLNYKKLPDFWKDLRVRQAILYAVDRKTIVEQVLQGTHSVLAGPVGFEQFYSDNVNWYEYNPEKAKQLLAEAGVKPADIEMNVVSHAGYNNALNNAALQATQGFLAQIGITKFTYKFLDIPSFRAVYKADGDWSIGYRGWGYPIFGANPAFLMSNAGGQGGDFSGYDYDSQGFPAVIKKVKSAPTLEEYYQALTELNDLHNSQLPELMMWVGNRYGAASKHVKDFHWIPAGGGGPYVDHAEKWYIGE